MSTEGQIITKQLLPKQAEALQVLLQDDTCSELLYGGAGGGGKSFLACIWLYIMCMRYRNTKYFIARRRRNSIYDSTLPTFYKVIDWIGDRRALWKYNDRKNTITSLRTGAEISLLATEPDASDPLYSRFGSREYTSGLFEEAQETVEVAYSALSSRVGRCYNQEYGITSKILLTCNPSRGWLYRNFYKPWCDGTLAPYRRFINATCTDNHFLSEDYLTRLENITDPQTRDRILKGLWDYEDEPSYLIPYRLLEEARLVTPDDNGPVVVGIDISLNGLKSDKTVCVARVGNRVLQPYIIPPADGLDAQEAVVTAIADYLMGFNDPLAVVDCSGTAAAVAARLQGLGIRTKRFYGAQPSPRDKEFSNLRSYCYYQLKEAVRLKKISFWGISDDAFFEEIAGQKYSNNGKILMENKDFIRRRLGRSPDLADALSMTFAAPVADKAGAQLITFNKPSARKHYVHDMRTR